MVGMHAEIPALRLPDASGAVISTRDYKELRPLVLAFADRQPSLLDELARRYDEYRAENAEVIGVVTSPPAQRLPFPVMIDTDGSATRRYVERTPAILVTDAFGALEGRFEHADHDRILALISAAEMRCPECGAPEWPTEDAP